MAVVIRDRGAQVSEAPAARGIWERGISIAQTVVEVALTSIALGVALVAGVGTLVGGALIAYHIVFPIAMVISDLLVMATLAYAVVKIALAVFAIVCVGGMHLLNRVMG